MSCYHPLKAWQLGVRSNGKKILKVTSYDVDHIAKTATGFECRSDDFVSVRDEYSIHDFIEIPCGNCIGCRIEYSRQWANRMLLELQYHESSYFLTLTYNDKNVPVSHYLKDKDTGEAGDSLTLVKADFQRFMKRLRKQSGQKLRFYACGEYGEHGMRPHYHAIIFGLKLGDLQEWSYDKATGIRLYRSPFIESLWPFGYSCVGAVTWESCAYTARYVTKKLKGEAKKFYEDFNIEPVFALMSRKPGLAYQYFQDHKDMYETDQIVISTEKGGKKFKPPRYYDQLFDIENPDELESVKEIRRKQAEALRESKLCRTDLSYLELLAVEEEAFKSKINSLKRSKV